MEFNKVSEWFLSVSEKILAVVINSVFSLVLIAPLILVDLFFKSSLLKIPVLFIPLSALYAMAIKCTVYAYYMIFVKQKLYYKAYFFQSLKENFAMCYIYYLISIGLLYIGLSSTWILIHNVSQWFWVLYVFLVLFILTNMIYTTLQFALYENNKLDSIVKNSMILSFMFAVISVAMTIILAWMIYKIQYIPFKIIFLGMPAYAGLILMVHLLIDRQGLSDSEMR